MLELDYRDLPLTYVVEILDLRSQSNWTQEAEDEVLLEAIQSAF